MDISIHDKPVRVVLDTGADMSVLPRDVLYSFYQISTWNHLLKLLKPLVVNNFY